MADDNVQIDFTGNSASAVAAAGEASTAISGLEKSAAKIGVISGAVSAATTLALRGLESLANSAITWIADAFQKSEAGKSAIADLKMAIADASATIADKLKPAFEAAALGVKAMAEGVAYLGDKLAWCADKASTAYTAVQRFAAWVIGGDDAVNVLDTAGNVYKDKGNWQDPNSDYNKQMKAYAEANEVLPGSRLTRGQDTAYRSDAESTDRHAKDAARHRADLAEQAGEAMAKWQNGLNDPFQNGEMFDKIKSKVAGAASLLGGVGKQVIGSWANAGGLGGFAADAAGTMIGRGVNAMRGPDNGFQAATMDATSMYRRIQNSAASRDPVATKTEKNTAKTAELLGGLDKKIVEPITTAIKLIKLGTATFGQ